MEVVGKQRRFKEV